MLHTSSSTTLAASAVVSRHVDPHMAAEQSCEALLERIAPDEIDLLLTFVSGGHVAEMKTIGTIFSEQLRPGVLLGASAGGVIGGDEEIEGALGITTLALSLPGTSLKTFTYSDLPHVSAEEPNDMALARVADAIGAQHDHRATLLFADPFSVPVASAVELISSAHTAEPGWPPVPIIGGVASAGSAPGQNMLLLNNRAMRSGGVGLSIRGDIEIDTLVSQGCKPIGDPLIITDAKRNVIKTLGGRPALEVLQQTISDLPPQQQQLVQNGMFLGRVVNEYKERFGRGDFLIRNVLGADQRSGAIAVADILRVGQTVQFHLRDARTATEDLHMLLGVQQLRRPAAAGLLVTCSGRGKAFFSQPNHDAGAIRRALVAPDGSPLPLAGLFAAGEIGPVGKSSFVHGHTACLTLFRAREKGFDEI